MAKKPWEQTREEAQREAKMLQKAREEADRAFAPILMRNLVDDEDDDEHGGAGDRGNDL